jgi:hypothetical protein
MIFFSLLMTSARLMHWLSKVWLAVPLGLVWIHSFVFSQQPAWGRSREFEITTRSVSRHGLTQTTTGDLEDDVEEDDIFINGRKKWKVSFMPRWDMRLSMLSGSLS